MEALLIIDVQEAYVSHLREEKGFLESIATINQTAELFRKAGKAVICIRHIAEGDDERFKNIKELNILDSDQEVLKTFNSGFWQTDLEDILNDLNIKFLVLAGYAAEFCISATFFGAKERAFSPVLLENGILAKTKEGLLASKLSRPHINILALNHMFNK